MRNQLLWFIMLLGCLLGGCGDDEMRNVTVQFSEATYTASERASGRPVVLTFDGTTPSNGVLEVTVTEFNAVYGVQYTTQPPANNGVITLNVAEGANLATVIIVPVLDTNEVTDSLMLTLQSGSAFFRIGEPHTSQILLTEAEGSIGPDDITITGSGSCNGQNFNVGTVQCNPGLDTDAFDIVSWNIEQFPNSSNTLSKAIEIIRVLDADFYAIQEVRQISTFDLLVNSLDGYEGRAVDIGGSLDLGFIYKSSEISSVSAATELGLNIRPRNPIMIDVTHVNGLQVKLLNVHLKCCSGAGNVSDRTDASEKLKQYVDNNFANEEVIILGDWNEDLRSGNGDSFDNFIDDPSNYAFTTLPLNLGTVSGFSYPSWPSHLDHILITDELCDNLVASYTVRLDDCDSRYFSEVSDHRPVMITLKAD